MARWTQSVFRTCKIEEYSTADEPLCLYVAYKILVLVWVQKDIREHRFLEVPAWLLNVGKLLNRTQFSFSSMSSFLGDIHFLFLPRVL